MQPMSESLCVGDGTLLRCLCVNLCVGDRRL